MNSLKLKSMLLVGLCEVFKGDCSQCKLSTADCETNLNTKTDSELLKLLFDFIELDMTPTLIEETEQDKKITAPRNEVNHPLHYQSIGGIEAIDVIEAFNLNFCLGNVIKYILRAGKKDDRTQDLNKALWYLKKEINPDE